MAPLAWGADTSASASAGEDTLEEVIVTAEKRPENVQKTAISITTISGEEIAKKANNELDQLLSNVPALQIEATPQGGAVYVRGVGTNGDSNFIEPSVSVQIDGVYSARSELLMSSMYDVSQGEVLRGPQGTLYGRDSDGGAVSINTNNPVLGNNYDTQINTQIGDYNLLHGDFAQNISLGDRLAVRVAGLAEDRDGYFSNNGYSSHTRAARVKVLYKPTDNWTLLGLFDYSRQSGDWTTTVAAPGALPSPPFPAAGWAYDPHNPWFVDSYHPADVIDYRFDVYALTSTTDFDWGTLTVIPTWTESDRTVASNLVVGDYFGPITPTINRETQKTGEVRLSAPANSSIKWVLGYYYLWSNNGQSGGSGVTENEQTINGTTYDIYDSSNLGASPEVSKAPYGQVTYPVTDQFRVTGGLRYTKETKSQASRYVSVAIPGFDSGVQVSNSDFSATTYKVGVEYDVRPQSMLYAQLSTGFKAGGFQGQNPDGSQRAFGPEHVKSYEIGMKNRFLNNTLQVNGSLYYYDYTDLQVQYSFSGEALPLPLQYFPTGATTTASFSQWVANAASGVNKGGELEVNYLFTPNDEFDLSAAYIDAYYGNFNSTIDPALTSGGVNLSGAPMAFTPRWSGTLSYQHHWSVMGGTLTAQADTKLSTMYYASVNNRGNRPDSVQPSYSRSNATLSYEIKSGSATWTTTAWMKNLENKAQIQFGDFPLNRLVVNYPRTYGLNLSLKF